MLSIRKKNKNKIIFLTGLLIAGFSAFYLVPNVIKLVLVINQYGFQSVLSQYGNKAALIYFLVNFLQPILLPLPEPITIMAGSKILGEFNGAVLGFLGTALGIITMYFFIRLTGSKFIDKFVSENQIKKFNKYISKHEVLVILSLFILPILPDEAICIGAGLMKLNAYKFMSIAIISKIVTSFSLSYSVKFIKINSIEIMLIIFAVLMIKKIIAMKKVKVN